jgi:hypothetical protein
LLTQVIGRHTWPVGYQSNQLQLSGTASQAGKRKRLLQIMATEWIINGNNASYDKQDCEQNIFKRLTSKLKKAFPACRYTYWQMPGMPAAIKMSCYKPLLFCSLKPSFSIFHHRLPPAPGCFYGLSIGCRSKYTG